MITMSSNHIASQLEMGLEAFPQFAEKEPSGTGAGGKPITSADVYACRMFSNTNPLFLSDLG